MNIKLIMPCIAMSALVLISCQGNFGNPAPTATLSSEQLYAQEIREGLNRIDAWNKGTRDQYLKYWETNQKALTDCLTTAGTGKSYCDNYKYGLAKDAVPLMKVASDEGFEVVRVLATATPPDSMADSHNQITECVYDMSSDLANTASFIEGLYYDQHQKVYVSSSPLKLSTSSPDPCERFDLALLKVNNFVQANMPSN